MDSTRLTILEKRLRNYQRFNLLLALVICVVCVAAFQKQTRRAKFDEIDVERINVVTRDGRYAVVIANTDRLPGNVIDGREHARGDTRGNGMLFYNSRGDEAGGLIVHSDRDRSSRNGYGLLSLDRLGSDQVVSVVYGESNDYWRAGLQVSHFEPDVLYEYHAARDSILKLPKARQDSALQQLRVRLVKQGKFEIPRLFAGQRGNDALLELRDMRGRVRIRLVVDSMSAARLEILDEKGSVSSRLP